MHFVDLISESNPGITLKLDAKLRLNSSNTVPQDSSAADPRISKKFFRVKCIVNI